MEIYKQKGKFWLPESSDHQVDGEFELIEESHGRLILFDVIDVIDDSVSKEEYLNKNIQYIQHPLIIGELNDGKGIALLQSSFRSISTKDFCNYDYGYNVDITVFTGSIMIGSVEDLVFNNISFSFDHLHHYLGACIIDPDFQPIPRSFSVKYTSVEDIFNLSDSILCRFNYVFDSSFSSYLSTTHIYPVTLIELESSSNISIRHWLDIIEKNIGAFFSIIVGKYLCPTRIKVNIEYEGKHYEFKVFYRYFNKHSELFHNKRNSLEKMMPGLKNYLAAFYNFATHYPLIIDNYLTLYKFDAILEYKFLSAVYSVESFSRYINPKHYYFSEADFENNCYKPLTEYINSNNSKFLYTTNKDYISRLTNSIKYSNELSLRAILKHIFDDNKDIIEKIFSDNIRAHIDKIVDTRNWYTHFTKELEPLAAKGYELVNLYKIIRVLFEVCLFKQLKMPEELIIQTIKNTYC